MYEKHLNFSIFMMLGTINMSLDLSWQIQENILAYGLLIF